MMSFENEVLAEAPSPEPVLLDKDAAANQIKRLVANVAEVFLGKETVIENAVLALAARGHVLLEDVPGLGKTLLAKALAKSVSGIFKRVQFTADLLPSDITGVTIYRQDRHDFAFRRGPVFTNILLGDEINRATPRTQSALLEAMEEQGVTVDGVLHPLAAPFFVMATQNPVELEGTYPLPFAQMDRFMVRLSVGYMSREAEMCMLESQQNGNPVEAVMPIMDCAELCRIQESVRQVHVQRQLLGYVVDLVQATRSSEHFEYGASPRASLDVQHFSQAVALLNGRDYVLPDDIKRAARLLLPHRLITRKGTRSVTVTATEEIEQVVGAVPVPL